MPSSSSCSSSSSSSCSSSCSSCSCSSCSSSSSSSYAAFYAPLNSVPGTGSFEILFHEGNFLDRVLVNSGVAYDGYGNRIACDTRTLVNLNWTGITENYAYLCVRMTAVPNPIDYQDHPVFGLPKTTKVRHEIEFYLSTSVVAVNFDIGGTAYYPPIDSNGIINGLVLGKVYKNALLAPELTPWRSPALAVKNSVFFPLNGFNV